MALQRGMLDLNIHGAIVSIQAGVVRVLCSTVDPLIFTGCLDGAVRVWDVRGGECVKEYQGHTRDLLDLTLAQ